MLSRFMSGQSFGRSRRLLPSSSFFSFGCLVSIAFVRTINVNAMMFFFPSKLCNSKWQWFHGVLIGVPPFCGRYDWILFSIYEKEQSPFFWFFCCCVSLDHAMGIFPCLVFLFCFFSRCLAVMIGVIAVCVFLRELCAIPNKRTNTHFVPPLVLSVIAFSKADALCYVFLLAQTFCI